MDRIGLWTPDVDLARKQPLNPRRHRALHPLILALGVISCGDGGEAPPPVADGSSLMPGGETPETPAEETPMEETPAETPETPPGEPVPTRPLLVEAEAGTSGASVTVVTDAEDPAITYLTASVDGTTAPADAADPRVVTIPVEFPEAGQYQIYARVRIGPNGGNDDSFFVDVGSEAPDWALANGLSGFPVQGEPGYQQGAVIDDLRGQSSTGVWMWALLPETPYTVSEGALARTFTFSTREDGLDIDKFAFAIVGDGYTTGFTPDQLDAGEPGVVVFPPVLPPPFEPPADQPPLAAGASKWLGMVCCGNQRPFLENYFNQVTPENAGKWGSVEAVRDEYNWAGLDEALAVATDNGFPFRFHVLLWGSQQPAWIATLPPEEQLEEIREWFEAVNERYGEALDYVEVVNEFDNQPPTAENEGNYIDALGGTGESGFDWVLTAFRMAREIFPPSAQLMLNEYSVVNSDERATLYVQLVEALQAEDLIDAIGVQGHAFSTRGPIEQMLANLDRLGATGLPIIVTEMDVDGPELVQLSDFQRLFRPFWEHGSVAGITLWGYRQGMWRDAEEATLVYTNGAEKPALRWLEGYLRGTAPVVAGPASVTLASGYELGTELGAFAATAPGGAAYPEGATISWGVMPGTNGAEDASQAVVFDEGSGLLRLDGARLSAGTYSVRVYVDVDATVSDLFEIAITVQ